MIGTVYTKSIGVPLPDIDVILRYAGASAGSEELVPLTESLVASALPELTYKVCYGIYPVSYSGETLDLGFMRTESKSLNLRLSGCEYVLVFGATVGIGIDRLAFRYEHTSPASALIIEAIGSERVESLCDAFSEIVEKEAMRKGYSVTKRFSPGYGDLPLEAQRDVLLTLGNGKSIGLSLTESLILSPKKSVTAIIGFKRNESEK